MRSRKKIISALVILTFLLGIFSSSNLLGLVTVYNIEDTNNTAVNTTISKSPFSDNLVNVQAVTPVSYNATIENTTIDTMLIARNTAAYLNNVTLNTLGTDERGYGVVENSTIDNVYVSGYSTLTLRNVTVTNIQVQGFNTINLENVNITGALSLFGVPQVQILDSVVEYFFDYGFSTVRV